MTVTVYAATFADPGGRKVHASVFWDKYRPRSLQAQLCPHLTESEVDYPVWVQAASRGRTGLESLVRKMKAKAGKTGLALLSEHETRFAARLEQE